ncbi:unnamed protein product [Sphenostylis stenocarpa]|uniref:Uncharacterized protein n=1 Tax=Sphenostylis stenocarpa TaxID=92480 RepID=A0AA86T3G8_9FABA|nr:unnamed protein product [Sphenostylis stenocarpa]
MGEGVVGEPEEEVFEDVELDLGGRRGGLEKGGAEIGEGARINNVIFVEEEGASPVREVFGGEDAFDEGEVVDGDDGSDEGAGGGEEGEKGLSEVVEVAMVDLSIGKGGVVQAEELGMGREGEGEEVAGLVG